MASHRGRGRSGRELHRFRNGQRCEECNARRWYAESGFRYCENGHRIEGFVEFDVDEDDNYGQQGRVVRKEKEAKEKTTRHLSGNPARELFLECLQLILRKQIWWLVQQKKLPSELETIVRDLWDLRVRNFAGLRAVDDIDGASASESGTDAEYFSSQAGSESEASVKTARSSVSRARSWTSEPGQHWDLPKLIDTLALCYTGCLLLRLPIRIGDLYNWAKDDQIPYLGSLEALPRDMRARLPGAYHEALMAQNTVFKGGELHAAVLELVMSFHFNYQMAFPPLNTPLLLMQYVRELSLPAEVYVYTRQIASTLKLEFSFDMRYKRFGLLQHPDILLVSCIVLTTNLLYPFDEKNRSPIDYNDPASLKMDWNRWRTAYMEARAGRLGRREVDKLTSEDAWTMTDAQINDYLDRYQYTKIRLDEGNDDMLALFPLSSRSRSTKVSDVTNEDIDKRMMTIQGFLKAIQPVPLHDDDRRVRRTGDEHEQYMKVEDLPETAKSFYEKAAEISGMSLGKLVKAVYKLETKIQSWAAEDRKAGKEDPVESD